MSDYHFRVDLSVIYDTISQVSTGSIQMVAVQWTLSKFTVVLRMEAVPRALTPRSGLVFSHKTYL